MLEILKQDLFRLIGNRCHSIKYQIIYLLKSPGFKYLYLFRRRQASSNRVSKIFWELMLQLQKRKTGIQIPSTTTIGKGFRILHFGNIVINPNAVIGENCTVAQGVLIGCSEGKKSGSPKIGNNVNIGANALILGGISLGNDVLIAPGAFVNFDVPDNCIVIGNPGKTIKKISPVTKYIVYSVYNYEKK